MNLTAPMDAVNRLSTKVKWLLGLVAAFVVAPVIFMVVKGLIGLAVAGLVGLTIINFAPVAALKFANWKLQGLKGEARANPIETRQNLALEARARIVAAQGELTTFTAEVKNFTDEVKELTKTQPEDAADFADQLRKLQQLLKFKQDGLAAAIRSAEQFEAATARAARKWKVAQSAIRMQRLAGAAADDAMSKILAEESLDSVQTAMNRALAELDTAIAMSAPPAITNQPSTFIDVNAVEVRERLHR